MDVQVRFSVVLKVSKVVKWSRIFVRSIRGLPNFLAIPIMNPLTRVHDILGTIINYCNFHYNARTDISIMLSFMHPTTSLASHRYNGVIY